MSGLTEEAKALKQYKVYWRNARCSGETKEPTDYKTAKIWADAMNEEYPLINHEVRNINFVA